MYEYLLYGILLIIFAYIIYLLKSYKEYRKYKEVNKKEEDIKKLVAKMDVDAIVDETGEHFKRVDLTQEQLDVISRATNRKCNWLDIMVAKHSTFTRYTHKERINGKECSINRIEITFRYCHHSRIGNFLWCIVEKHDGEPKWINKEIKILSKNYY